jgi:hypothetical protein
MNRENRVSEKHYPWDASYVAAILETDNARLPARIEAAKAIIGSRIDESNGPSRDIRTAESNRGRPERPEPIKKREA